MATDSFAPSTRVPTSVETLEIILTVTSGSPNDYAGRYTFDILDATGTPVDVRNGNLTPHLTAAQVTAIKSFLDALLIKAQGSIAP